jgi:GGDEF domain-containing protein
VSEERFLADIQAAAADSIRWAFRACAEVLGARRATLLLRETDEDVMRAVAWVGIDAETAAEIEVPIGHGLAGVAAENNMTLYGDARGTKYMIVPVVRANRVVGVMNLTERDADEFTDTDIRIARAMAEHIAYLLSQARHSGVDVRSGLPDQHLFIDALEREIERARRVAAPFTLALIRIPDLPWLLESLGDDGLGELLRRVGAALQSACRRYDVVGQLDADTFGLLFPATDSITEQTVSRLVDIVAQRLEPHHGNRLLESAVVHFPADGAGVRELLGLARRLCSEGDEDDGSGPTRLLWPTSR